MGAPVATLFADFTCPFCYVTEAALRRVAAARGVLVRHRAYELFPAPAPPPSPASEPGWREAVSPLARELGLTLRAPAFRPRTRKAHEAARFAAERGVEDEMRVAIYAAFWAEERDIGRIDVLAGLATPLGVDPADLRIALDIDRHRDEVLRDLAAAEQLRLPGVPTLFLGEGAGARVLVGMQTPGTLDDALTAG